MSDSGELLVYAEGNGYLFVKHPLGSVARSDLAYHGVLPAQR